VFQIGATLHEARERRGLSLEDVERATRVRARYLGALEDERFELLPPGGYRRTFLRGYANFLGLDGDRFVDAYASRFERPEPHEAVPTPAPAARRPPSRRFGSVIAAVVGAALLAAGLAAWLVPGRSSVDATVVTPPADTTTGRHTQPPPAVTSPPARAAPLDIVFTATGGRCWLLVRRGGAAGRLLFEGTLEQGRRVALHAPGLWARIGAPWNVTLTVDGVQQALPSQLGNVLVDRSGTRPTA
jgi:hypothetical protein